MPEEGVILRKYFSSDRAAVREICCDTAYMGKPVENFFFDREIFADLIIKYYTDFEPGSFWVAENEGIVVGYLSGCLDTRRYIKIMKWHLVPSVLLKALLRGVFLRLQTYRLIYFSLKSLTMPGAKRSMPFDKYPAHLHIDIKSAFRGAHIGSSLMEKFLGQLKGSGIKGVFLSTLEDNLKARSLFEKMGFSVYRKNPVYIPAGKTARTGFSLIYVKAL